MSLHRDMTMEVSMISLGTDPVRLDNPRMDQIDARVTRFMARHGVRLSRMSLGIVFLWFGFLKLFPGLSPAENLAGETIRSLSLGLLPPELSVPVLGGWESLIGLGLLAGRFLRITLIFLFVQMMGTATPLLVSPNVVFEHFPFVLTLEGQYIAKNLVLISSAIVIGATIRGGALRPGLALEGTCTLRRPRTPGRRHPRHRLSTLPRLDATQCSRTT